MDFTFLGYYVTEAVPKATIQLHIVLVNSLGLQVAKTTRGETLTSMYAT